MKNKKSKALWILPCLLVVLVLVWYGYSQSEFYPDKEEKPVWQPQTMQSGKTVSSTVLFKNPDSIDKLTDSQSKLLQEFAMSYAKTLTDLQPQDISVFFADTNSKNYYQNVAAYTTLCNIRKMSCNDLRPTLADVTYYVDTVRLNGDTAVITLTEDNIQQFKHLYEPSYSYNINHIFKLKNIDGSWFITDHQQEEDFFLLAQQAWDNAAGATNREKAQSTQDILVADAQENIDALKISTGNPPQDIAVKNTAYNREAAVAYAKEWCNKRNYTDRWLAYDEYGGNCQNFASQCIYAGGIDMDYKGYGESQWKFYSQVQNNKQTPSGRSYSWTGVDPFYTYATINRSNGLICQRDLALEYARPGDVIQVGAYYEWRHSLVVTDVMLNDDGTLQDIIVASNTADRWNYPLSAYIYTYPRLIHILGQN